MKQVHRLFFAVRPDAAAATVAAAVGERVRTAHRLTGKLLPTEHLHVTLHWLHDHESLLPPDLLADALRAGGNTGMAPFDVVFDRVGSLGGRSHGGPLVLTGAAGPASLRRFQRALAAAMTDAGIGAFVRSRFKPHMTLLYDDRYVAPQPIEPFRWTVSELLLVDSLVGKSTHIVLGHWPLHSPQASFDDW